MSAKHRLNAVLCAVSLVTVFLVSLPMGCSPDPCRPDQIEQHLGALRDVSRRFEDATTVADNASTMSLPSAIEDLQALQGEAENLEVLPCAIDAKNLLVAHMDATVDAFIALLSEKPDDDVAAAFHEAEQLLMAYRDELLALTDPKGEADRRATATAAAISTATRAAEVIEYEVTKMADDAASTATQAAEDIAYELTKVWEGAVEQVATAAAE